MEFGKYIAHRGIHGNGVPENSLRAFSLAVENNISIELDVHLTKDGKIVVIHDNDLLRMTGVEGKICDFTYEQLCAFTLCDSNERIPLLSQVLKLVNSKVPLLIEIKGGSAFGCLEKRVIHLMKKYKGDYAVESFNPFSMLYFRIFSPKTKRGQLVSGYRDKKNKSSSYDFEYIARKICTYPIVWKLISKPDYVCADLRCVTLDMTFKAIDCGADFITWTARGNELIEAAAQFSKSVICEDFPEDFDFSSSWEVNDEN